MTLKVRGPWQRSHARAVLWLCLVIAGCGSSEQQPPELSGLAPVTGRVRFQGQPIHGAVVTFHAADNADPQKPPIASGLVDAEGEFSVNSSISRFIEPGTAPGSYRLTVSWLESVPTAADSEAVKERLPRKYQNPQTSGLVANVEPGANDLGEITLDAK